MELADAGRLKLVDMALALIGDSTDPRAPDAIVNLQAQRVQIIKRMGKPETQVVHMKAVALNAQRN